MDKRIFETLGPVRRRQRGLLTLQGAALGLLTSSLAGIALGLWRWNGTGQVHLAWSLGLLAAGPLLGALVGLLRGKGWGTAASAIDARYQLKDRVVTALDFLRRPAGTALHELQVADAEQHLLGVDPRRVVPFRAPASLPWALGTSLVALALLLWPRPSLQARPVAPLEEVVAAAEDARIGLEELEKVAEKQEDKNLERLVQMMRDKIEEMKQPGVDVREALAKLSEMQSAIAAQQAMYNVGLVDAQMKSLGEALAVTQSLESAGNSLQQEKYNKAAQELEQAEPSFERKESRTLKEKLKQTAKAMGLSGLGELGESTNELAESLEDANSCEGALKKLGKLARSQGRRKEIGDLLKLQSQCLSECKGNCQKNGGAQVRLRKKSDKPSSTWGRGISGNTDGEKTALDSTRKQDNLKGQMDEGPSEIETVHSPEGRQAAARAYREQYQKYRRLTEAALNSEPIPLGHRQTIRRYFELIRPQGDEVEKSGPPAGTAPSPSL
jgi:hypothetical protein